MHKHDRLSALARQIDTARKSEHRAKSAEEIAALRRHGACELHAICASFVSSVNSRLSDDALTLSPATYAPEAFQTSGVNLIQMGSRGREIHISFQTPRELISTEKYLIPYVLDGEVRAFNQRMLERLDIRSQLLFFCLEEDKTLWRFFDWRTRHTGAFGSDLLLTLMEKLFV